MRQADALFLKRGRPPLRDRRPSRRPPHSSHPDSRFLALRASIGLKEALGVGTGHLRGFYGPWRPSSGRIAALERPNVRSDHAHVGGSRCSTGVFGEPAAAGKAGVQGNPLAPGPAPEVESALDEGPAHAPPPRLGPAPPSRWICRPVSGRPQAPPSFLKFRESQGAGLPDHEPTDPP